MIVNFRAREISRGARKLTRTPTLIIKKKHFIVKLQRVHLKLYNSIELSISGYGIACIILGISNMRNCSRYFFLMLINLNYFKYEFYTGRYILRITHAINPLLVIINQYANVQLKAGADFLFMEQLIFTN